LAGVAPTLGVLSQKNTETAIDVWIEKFDPVAVHCTRTAARSRCIEFGAQEDPAGTVAVWGRLLATDAAVLRARLTALGAQEDPAGTVAVWGRLLATDAAVLRARLTALAATVCEADPRTVGQRRADAMGLLAVDPTADRLTCLCGEPGCPAAGVDPRSAAVTVYVLTDTVPGAAADTPRDPGVHGDDLQGLRAPAAVTGTPGVIPGGGVVPAPLVAELVATGARVATLADTNDLTAEPRYRPSAKLAAWVRTRDLTCTFPGCHRGAQYCDLDHSVPWPGGATHPGNLAALCRTHHLLKTFAGWSTVQHPDGTHTWTNPTGHTYTTVPLTRILFPDKPIHTPAPPPTPAGSGSGVGDRGLAMPRRRRTRAHTHTARINAERRLNQHTLEQNATPPPF
ncbi:HNH endonuclease signature motif containing protein, partial [Mycolicibacterium fluoranthenivorans]|uniref:HNH endonuclease signature motif containing protein n=1 Tax=Mycolicibacterium fluoranthenivorans TaxID=258505 RepID=UPI0021F31DBA